MIEDNINEPFSSVYAVGSTLHTDIKLSPCLTEGSIFYRIGHRMKVFTIRSGRSFEDEVALKQQLEHLPKKELGVIALRAAGYTQVETARIMNLSRTSIGSIERRVYATMRGALENNGSSS